MADRASFATEDVESALRSLSDLVRLLQAGRPREVSAIFPSPWLLYTDGACEEASSTFSGISVGAVSFSPAGSAQFFGTEVPRVFMDEIGLRHQTLVVSRYTWETLLRDVALISFVDNDAARHSVISVYSPSLASSRRISESACWDAKLGVFAGTARVPSASNIADGLSRLDYSMVLAMGAAEAQMLGATGSLFDWQVLARQLMEEGRLG